jgi:hypothetical protein
LSQARLNSGESKGYRPVAGADAPPVGAPVPGVVPAGPGVVVPGADVPGKVLVPGVAVPGVAPVAGGTLVGPGAVFVHGAISVDVGDVGVVIVLVGDVGPIPGVLLDVLGVVPGTLVDPAAVAVPAVAAGVPMEVPVVPIAEGEPVDVVEPPTGVFGAIGVRPSPTIVGLAGDTPDDGLPMPAVVEVAPGAVATPAVVAGRHGSGLPFGTGAPGRNAPDCGVVAPVPPGFTPVAVEGVCAWRETMSAAVSRAVPAALAALMIFT